MRKPILLELVHDPPTTSIDVCVYDYQFYQYGDYLSPRSGDIRYTPTPDIITDGENLYTERPDGTWYKLVDFWDLSINIDRQIYRLMESGMEPWKAFEIVAL